MNIRIVNLKNYKKGDNEILIKVDRSSPVGNIFYMKDESMRDEVCNKYEEYFNSVVTDDIMCQLNMSKEERNKFIFYLDCIFKIHEVCDIALGCWCYPKHCHAETIKNYIEIRE